jgi:hypothetical protein
MIRRAPLKRTALKPGRSRPNAKRPGVRRGPMRSRQYLDWLKERSCVGCATLPRSYWLQLASTEGRELSAVDPAHGPVNGTGSKGPDNEAVPLCRHHHDEQHRIGWPAFERKYGFSREKEAATHWAAFLLTQAA